MIWLPVVLFLVSLDKFLHQKDIIFYNFSEFDSKLSKNDFRQKSPFFNSR